MKLPWQTRAEKLRDSGHTIVFAAQQVARTFPVKIVDVIAFLTRIEREREMKKGEQA